MVAVRPIPLKPGARRREPCLLLKTACLHLPDAPKVKDPQTLLDVEQGLCVDKGLRTLNGGRVE